MTGSSTPDRQAPLATGDDWLIQACLSGNDRAFDALVMKYQARVNRLIGRWVKDTHAAEDLTQEVFIRAYKALADFRGDAQFYTWLYRIAVNAAKKHLMAQSREAHTVSMVDIDSAHETFLAQPDSHTQSIDPATPESILASQELAQALEQALSSLPQGQREAITLREIEGMSYEEIASAMDSPVGTVRSRIFRAREEIARLIHPFLNPSRGKRW